MPREFLFSNTLLLFGAAVYNERSSFATRRFDDLQEAPEDMNPGYQKNHQQAYTMLSKPRP